MPLRTMLFAAAFVLPATIASAQATAPDLKTFAASAEVQALIAKAKTEPPKPQVTEHLIGTGGYVLDLEYRTGVAAPATVHKTESELMFFVDGTGTLTTGGSLVNIRSNPNNPNPVNLSGSGISGGTPQQVEKGVVAIVPAGTPHQITPDAGSAVVVLTFHVPSPWPGK